METFSIAFFTKKERANEKGEVPIFIRITVNGKRAELPINEKIEADKWQKGRAFGNSTKCKNISKSMDSYTAKAREYYRYFFDRNEQISAQRIADMMKGKKTADKTLLWLCDKYLLHIFTLLNKGYADATLVRYTTTKNHIQEFLKWKYRKDDIVITELSHELISDFEVYFKAYRKCNHNTTMKYLKNLKAVVNMAVKNDWLDKDPFKNFSCKVQPVERDFLTEDEITRIREKAITITRLAVIRDAFVLACYTGLAYVDIKRLNKEHIVTGVDGAKWIYIDREKTNVISKIPIMPVVNDLIARYSDNVYYKATGNIIPIPSNQKVNAYLKELADLAGITKNLTFHLARHSIFLFR